MDGELTGLVAGRSGGGRAANLHATAEPVSRQVFRALRSAIVTMALKPGEALSE